MFFANVIEAAVATSDGITLMDKKLRKAGDTDAADADTEDFGWRKRKIHKGFFSGLEVLKVLDDFCGGIILAILEKF